MGRIVDHLEKAIRSAAIYNPEVQVAPVCILWPDRDRQWEAVIPRLQNELPELFALGEYAPDKKTGPAIWLRCVVAGKIPEVSIPHPQKPILYLPGVGRQDLRAIDSCPQLLKPLAELQYRGTYWSQLNAKDWTILAFLKSDQGGLGLDVAQDNESKKSMQLALHRLLDEDCDILRGRRLDKDFFNTLLTGGDPIRDLLQWLDQGETFKNARPENEWSAFVQVINSQLGFNPEKSGQLAAAEKLAERKGPWSPVWSRYCESPKRYPQIPGWIRKVKPPKENMMWQMGGETFSGWPQWNEDQENDLRKDLLKLSELPEHKARQRLIDLERLHGGRRNLVWAELGEATLANALQQLSVLAEQTQQDMAVGDFDDIASNYKHRGWLADSAVVRALEHVDKSEDIMAIFTAIKAVYLSWIDSCARHLQKLAEEKGYPGNSFSPTTVEYHDNECILFVDGLRFDVGKQLVEKLTSKDLELEETVRWTALPSITATGKHAVSPIVAQITGKKPDNDFEPIVAETEQSLKGGYHFKKILNEAGWTVLGRSEVGDGAGNGWCEYSNIDHEGHDRGWKIAKHLDGLLNEIVDRVLLLLNAGWRRIRIVTDHGWILMPGGLPKIEISNALTENKWGRCATIKAGASYDALSFPWFWNKEHSIALAEGVSCFRQGVEYTHGGLSLQECFVSDYVVIKKAGASGSLHIEITDVVWKGMRCTVAADGSPSNVYIDIREFPGEPASSLALSPKPLSDSGKASVAIEDDDFEGKKAWVVAYLDGGEVIAQVGTVIGGQIND